MFLSPERADSALSKMRSSSALSATQPSSQPPTPTHGVNGAADDAHTAAGAEREHGDLIKFYNVVYVLQMKDFAMKFAKSKKAAVSRLAHCGQQTGRLWSIDGQAVVNRRPGCDQ